MDTREGLDPIIFGRGSIQGIVSVSANYTGRATVYVRENGKVIKKIVSFTPWALTSNRRILDRLKGCRWVELKGDLPFKYQINIADKKVFEESAIRAWNILHPNSSVENLHKINDLYFLNATEQFLVSTGHTYYKGLTFIDVLRLQIDIETTGLDSKKDFIYMIALRSSSGFESVIHGHDEKDLLIKLTQSIQQIDPDIIENHNLFGFDLPFLIDRFKVNGLKMSWGRDNSEPYFYSDKLKTGETTKSFQRVTINGREILDTYHAVERYDAVKREMAAKDLKYTAKYFGVARPDDCYIDGSRSYEIYKENPELVIRYALEDVREVDRISQKLHPDKFAMAQMAPLKLEKVATSGSTTLIELPMVREYLHQGHSIPVPAPTEPFEGATVDVLAIGVFDGATKIDVTSQYPSIILNFKISPLCDPLGVFQKLAKTWVDMRLEHKAKRTDPTSDAIQSAMKILINSLYGYLATSFGLFNNPMGAAEITKKGREIAKFILTTIIQLRGKPIEVDTDGIITQLPIGTSPKQFSNLINEILKSQYPGIVVEDEGLWLRVYVKGKKNYAYLKENGENKFVGTAFKNRSVEKVFRNMIAQGLESLLKGDLASLRQILKDIHDRIQSRACCSDDIQTTKKLGKSLAEYLQNPKPKQPHFEVMINAGFLSAEKGTPVSYYKTTGGYKHIDGFANDYDISHYLKTFYSKASVFREAVSDFESLLNFDVESIPSSTFTDLPPATVNTWINLSSYLKHTPMETGTREKIVMLDDEDTIHSFINQKEHTDVYRSFYAFYSQEKPKKADSKNLLKCKMKADFWIECEGHFENSEIMDTAVLALNATIELLRTKFGIEHIRTYYNGGKSFYIRIPYSYFIEEPVYRLEAKYELLFKDILASLPPNLKSRLDTSLYDITQVLRIPNTMYPKGGYMVELISNINVNNWREIVGSIEPSDELDPFFMPAPPLEQTTTSKKIFSEVTQQARFKTYRTKTGSQKDQLKQIEKFLEANPMRIAPCLKNIVIAIANGNPIGFGGKAKLIYEATRLGLCDQTIVKMFLLDPDTYCYGVLNVDYTTESGYRLKQAFCKSKDLDVGCGNSDLSGFCEPTSCYRSEMKPKDNVIVFGQDDPTFQEFQTKAQEELKEFLNVNCAECPSRSGKDIQHGTDCSQKSDHSTINHDT